MPRALGGGEPEGALTQPPGVLGREAGVGRGLGAAGRCLDPEHGARVGAGQPRSWAESLRKGILSPSLCPRGGAEPLAINPGCPARLAQLDSAPKRTPLRTQPQVTALWSLGGGPWGRGRVVGDTRGGEKCGGPGALKAKVWEFEGARLQRTWGWRGMYWDGGTREWGRGVPGFGSSRIYIFRPRCSEGMSEIGNLHKSTLFQ